MKYFRDIGSYFLMLKRVFSGFTKGSVLRELIVKEIDDLIIGSMPIVAFISFFVGGVIAIQTALNIDNPLIPAYLVGFATRQSIILEFAPTFMSKLWPEKWVLLLLPVLALCGLPNRLMRSKLWASTH